MTISLEQHHWKRFTFAETVDHSSSPSPMLPNPHPCTQVVFYLKPLAGSSSPASGDTRLSADFRLTARPLAQLPQLPVDALPSRT